MEQAGPSVPQFPPGWSCVLISIPGQMKMKICICVEIGAGGAGDENSWRGEINQQNRGIKGVWREKEGGRARGRRGERQTAPTICCRCFSLLGLLSAPRGEPAWGTGGDGAEPAQGPWGGPRAGLGVAPTPNRPPQAGESQQGKEKMLRGAAEDSQNQRDAPWFNPQRDVPQSERLTSTWGCPRV